MPCAAPVTIATRSVKRAMSCLLLSMIRDEVACCLFLRGGDQLGLEVLLESGHTEFAADAGLLVAAERGVGAVPDAAVDAEGSGPNTVDHVVDSRLVGAPHLAREPVGRFVGQPDGVVVAVVR